MPSAVMGGTSSGEGGGITNSAPVNTIPVTLDGDGNLGDSDVTWQSRTLTFTASENEDINIAAAGLGVQLHISAAPGDASHVGGEVSISSGNSSGAGGGQINIVAGEDANGGQGGNIVISSGRAASGGGNGGDIDIRASQLGRSDGNGGNINLVAGDAVDGSAGDVLLQAGNSTNGSQGTVQLFSANGNEGIEVQNTAVLILANLNLAGVPSSDPSVVGQVWNDGGTLKISAG